MVFAGGGFSGGFSLSAASSGFSEYKALAATQSASIQAGGQLSEYQMALGSPQSLPLVQGFLEGLFSQVPELLQGNLLHPSPADGMGQRFDQLG
jgi:hypothetical protein